MTFLTNLLGEGPWATIVAIALGLMVLAFVVILIYRLTIGRGLRAAPGARARQPRLGIVDAFDLDRQRQLVLVRRDNVEHLIMIGGPNDLLIEPAIIRGQPSVASDPRREGAPANGQSQDRPSPRIPAFEASRDQAEMDDLPPRASSFDLPPREAPPREAPRDIPAREPAPPRESAPAFAPPPVMAAPPPVSSPPPVSAPVPRPPSPPPAGEGAPPSLSLRPMPPPARPAPPPPASRGPAAPPPQLRPAQPVRPPSPQGFGAGAPESQAPAAPPPPAPVSPPPPPRQLSAEPPAPRPSVSIDSLEEEMAKLLGRPPSDNGRG